MERSPVRHRPENTRRDLTGWLTSLYHRGLRKAGVVPDIPEDIRAIGPRLGEVPGVERVLLVGSWARGQGNPDSDVDLIVVQRENGEASERHAVIRERLEELERPLDIVLYTPGQFVESRSREGAFAAHLAPEAVVLFGDE